MTLKISKNNAFNSIQFGGFRQICNKKNPRNEESKALSAITKMQISYGGMFRKLTLAYVIPGVGRRT